MRVWPSRPYVFATARIPQTIVHGQHTCHRGLEPLRHKYRCVRPINCHVSLRLRKQPRTLTFARHLLRRSKDLVGDPTCLNPVTSEIFGLRHRCSHSPQSLSHRLVSALPLLSLTENRHFNSPAGNSDGLFSLAFPVFLASSHA